MPPPLRDTLEKLVQHQDLTTSEAAALMLALTDPELPPAMAGAMLAALRSKGVRAPEVRGFAQAMRSLARRPQIADLGKAVDVVGTGGDSSGSFNLSTGAALVAAAAGARVVKHGNRSVSSRSGSADLLEALGLKLPLDEKAAGECLERTGFTFLFAPHYHPALKVLAPVRAALGVRTIFNMMGPLLNPAATRYGVVGTFSLEVAELFAETFSELPIERIFVIHGEPGWDEATPVGPVALFDVRPGSVQRSQRTAADYGLASCQAEDLAGGDAAHNAASLLAVFRGEDRGPHRDALIMGTALALEVIGLETTPRAAAARAALAIDSGAALALVESLRKFSAEQQA
jgi:anthranilate phosphoribosyltransferase